MSCTCLCHNSFAAEQGKTPHAVADCACTKEVNPTMRAQVEITEQVEEQLLHKAELEAALRSISDGHGCELHKCGLIAQKALEPKALCRACRKLSPSFPCVHCGNASA